MVVDDETLFLPLTMGEIILTKNKSHGDFSPWLPYC